MIFTKNKEGVRPIRTMKYKNICGWKIYSRTRTFGADVTNPISTQSSSAHVVENDTNRIFESKDDTTSMKIVNYIERHNFC